MTERPILFSGPMVRAILEGRKTQTRRVVKPQPAEVHHCQDRDSYPFEVDYDQQDGKTVAVVKYTMGEIEAHFCPYGQPGDRLWVRETFVLCESRRDDGKPAPLYRATSIVHESCEVK